MRTVSVLAVVLAVTGIAAAVTVDFDAVSLRPANDGSGYGQAQEFADQTGAQFNIPLAGQKALYGTKAVNGLLVSDVQYIEFTWLDGPVIKAPYTNMVITNGAVYGVISSQGGVMQWENNILDGQNQLVGYQQRRRYYFAGNNGNETFNFKFYEPVNTSWSHGEYLTYGNIENWTILGVNTRRPLFSGEEQFGDPQARAPVDHGLAIMWGDSESNYLGWREIYDVEIELTNGTTLVAGAVPEPLTMVALFGGVSGLAGYVRRRRRA